jgi:L-asparagine transporter-like permease
MEEENRLHLNYVLKCEAVLVWNFLLLQFSRIKPEQSKRKAFVALATCAAAALCFAFFFFVFGFRLIRGIEDSQSQWWYKIVIQIHAFVSLLCHGCAVKIVEEL